MPETSVQHGRAFDENIDILFDEIVLAEQWSRPSLLLAVHKSKFGQVKAEQVLEERLVKDGFRVERLLINDQRADIAKLIREAEPGEKSVFFISNVDWGGGEDGRQAYRALNLHRELFVEEAIKAVFWLTVNEAANLPRFAPDFWAFRHRVVEFVSQRAPATVQLPVGVLAWDVQPSPDPFESLEASIQGREELLRKLPDSLEALAPRVELHASIGRLSWSMGDTVRAAAEFEKGMELAKNFELPELKANLLNAMGVLSYEAGEHAAALERFTEGLQFRSSSPVLLINSSAAQCTLGRVQEALSLGQRAVRANPSEAGNWSRLGYIQNAAGRTDEAITCLAKAADLAPRNSEHHISLAVMYSLIDRTEDCKLQLTRANELAGSDRTRYVELMREAALGDPNRAVEMLKDALATGVMTRYGVRRDPNLPLLLEAEQLQEVLG